MKKVRFWKVHVRFSFLFSFGRSVVSKKTAKLGSLTEQEQDENTRELIGVDARVGHVALARQPPTNP